MIKYFYIHKIHSIKHAYIFSYIKDAYKIFLNCIIYYHKLYKLNIIIIFPIYL